MTKLLIYVGFLVALVLLFALVHRCVASATYERSSRFFHIRYLAAFLVFAAASTNRYAFSGYLYLTGKLINAQWLTPFWNIVMPQREYELVYLLLSFLITNLIFILASGALFHLIKAVFRNRERIEYSDTEGIEKLLHLPWAVNDALYGYDEESGKYQVSNRGFTMSIWAKWMKYAFLIIGLIEVVFLSIGIFKSMPIISEYGVDAVKGWYLLPAAGFLLMEQIQLYLEGTIEYHADSFYSEDISDRLEGSLELLRFCFREEYKDSDALIADFRMAQSYDTEGTASNELSEEQKNKCEQPQVLQMMDNQIKLSGHNLSMAYQNALLELLNGKSVCIRDFISGEIMPYLTVFMNYFLSQKRTFLVLCRDGSQGESIRKSILEEMNHINQIYNIWTVSDAESAASNEKIDILVCSWNELLQQELTDKRNAFFHALKGVIITDGMQFTTRINPHKELLFAKLNQVIGNDVNYVLVTEDDNVSLRTAFEHYFGQELVPFKNDLLPKETHVMLWREESCYKIQRYTGISSDEAPYIGVAMPLALTALKYDMPHVNIYSDGSQSYHTEEENLEKEEAAVRRYLRAKLDFTHMIRINPNPQDEQEELTVQILYDREFNPNTMMTSWIKYGGKGGSLAHIVSPPYMLREFFAEQLSNGIIQTGEFDAIASYESGQKKSIYLEILLKLASSGMKESEIRKICEKYSIPFKSITKALQDSLHEVLGDRETYSIYEYFRFEPHTVFDPDANTFVYETVVTLADETIRDRINNCISGATLVVKDQVKEPVSIPVGDVKNRFLNGQTVSIHGYQYQIRNISEDNIYAEQNVVQERKLYTICSEFEITRSKEKKEDQCKKTEYVDYTIYHADVKRKTYGYWESNCGFRFEDPTKMKLIQLKGEPDISRKDIRVLELKIRKDRFGESSKGASNLIVFMLTELFKTLFPYSYMDLVAVSEEALDENYWDDLYAGEYNDDINNKIHSVIPFVRIKETAKSSDDITIHIVEFSKMEKGMLQGLYYNMERVFSMMRRYLEWYLTDDEENKHLRTYLNLGFDTIPDCFAADAVLQYLRSMLPEYKEVKKTEEVTVEAKIKEQCSFCGRPTSFGYQMDDKRILCRRCKSQQVSQEDEIKELYVDVITQMQRHYRIEIPKGIAVRMKSGKSIRKKVGGHMHRVLGFFNSKDGEVWIESRGPRNSVRSTMAHELTHVWQNSNLDRRKLRKLSPELQLYLKEGHASFMEVDCMRRFGEPEYADYLEESLLNDKSEYGIGFRVFKECMSDRADEGSVWTPFTAALYLLDNPDELERYARVAKAAAGVMG